MNRSGSPIDPKKPLPEDEQVEGDGDSHFMYVKGEEEDYKVNTRKLFIGNVPFSSNWMSLKKFLVTKSNEIEPGNDLQILRVEIPMQTTEGMYGMDQFSMTSKSRGFAIVTTGNKETSSKLIEMFDTVEFEGRPLTVRFDRFPEFSNYNIQSTKPGFGYHGPSMLNYLAFERNLYQQKMYYGAPQQGNPGYAPYYNNAPSPLFDHGLNRGYRFKNLDKKLVSSAGAAPVSSAPSTATVNSAANMSTTSTKITASNVPVAKETVQKEDSPEEIRFKKNQQILNDEEKARDLVIAFKNLGLDSPV